MMPYEILNFVILNANIMESGLCLNAKIWPRNGPLPAHKYSYIYVYI